MAPKPKLTPAEIAEVNRLHHLEKKTQAQLAEQFNVGRTTIAQALAAGLNQEIRALSAPAEPQAGLVMLSTADILQSSLNPRKIFDENAMAELVASIEANGLLQNLVVRPAANGFYSLVAGERRFRAIRYLEENNRWNAKFPCRVIEGDDATHLALALLENLQRVDVSPIEEADAFVQLQAIDKAAWSAANIAARIGKSTRYVQQRIAIASKLDPSVRQALADRRITVEAARLLTTVSPAIQADILDRAEPGRIDTDSIKWELRGTLIEVADALFDPLISGLEIIDLDGEDYFADTKAAAAEQKKAVAKKAKELQKKWHFVQVIDDGRHFSGWEYLSGKTKAQGAGAIIHVAKQGCRVTIYEGMLKKPPAPVKTDKPGRAHPGSFFQDDEADEVEAGDMTADEAVQGAYDNAQNSDSPVMPAQAGIHDLPANQLAPAEELTFKTLVTGAPTDPPRFYDETSVEQIDALVRATQRLLEKHCISWPTPDPDHIAAIRALCEIGHFETPTWAKPKEPA